MTEVLQPYAGCEVCEAIPAIKPEFILHDGQYWLAHLRHTDQTLLGTSFVVFKRHVSELDKLTPAEDHELIMMRNALMKAIRKSFGPITFNFSSLKNNAFRSAPDSTPAEAAHVHYHLHPRYGSQPVNVEGEEFTDPMPGHYLANYERHVPAYSTAVHIARTIRTNLHLVDPTTKQLIVYDR